jgi:flagellar hook-associated protein 1
VSLASLLSIARSAMTAQQRAMTVTAHNVANAQTTGYSRQRIQLTAAVPEFTPLGTIGRGVTDAGVQRIRDSFYDSRYRGESGLLGNSTTMGDVLGQVEAAINEPSDNGIASSLDGLFNAFSDLANNPTSTTTRTLVQQAGRRFAQQLSQLDATVAEVANDALTKMREQVSQVNDLTSQIADLNQQILAYGGADGNAPDLQDRRDLVVDQLSNLVGVRVLQRQDGSIGVLAGDTMLVDGAGAQTLTVQSLGGGAYGLATAGGTTVDPKSGSLKALTDLVSTTLPGIRAKLDQLAQAVVTTVNAIHRTGVTGAGGTGVDFFDPAGVTAQSIGLSAAVGASADAIAAGTGASGDGSVARQIANLSTATNPALGGRSFRDFYTDLAGEVGSDVSSAQADADAYQTTVDQADTMRASVSGVSVDDEMVALITQQQAYTAAARIVNVADDMIKAVLDMI